MRADSAARPRTHWIGGVPHWTAPCAQAKSEQASRLGPVAMEVLVWLREVGAWKCSAEAAAALGLRMASASSTLRNLADQGRIERTYIAARVPRYRALEASLTKELQ